MKLKRLLALTASAFLALSLAVLPNTSFAAAADKTGLDRDWNGNLYPYRYGFVYMKSGGGGIVHCGWSDVQPADGWSGQSPGYIHWCHWGGSHKGGANHGVFCDGSDIITPWFANQYSVDQGIIDRWDGPSPIKWGDSDGYRSTAINAGYYKGWGSQNLSRTYPMAYWGGWGNMGDGSYLRDTDGANPNAPTLSGTSNGWVKNAPTIYASATDSGSNDGFLWWNANTNMQASGDWGAIKGSTVAFYNSGVDGINKYKRPDAGINHYEYRFESGTWSGMPQGTNYVRVATPGTNKLYFRAVDNTKRASAEVATTVKLDDKAPVITATPSTNAWVAQLTINVSTTDKNSNGTEGSQTNRIEWQRAGDSTWQSIRGGAGSATITRNGTYYFRAIDNVGWASNTVSVVVNNVDEIPPTVSVDWDKSPVKETDLKITAADVGGGLTGWAVTDSLAVPSAGQWQPLSNLANFKTNYHITENKPYYIHVKDVANNHAVALADVKSLDRYAPVIFQIQVKGGS